MHYEVESFGISDLGLIRENNEDVFHEIPMHRFFVLADGMGGHNAGEIAAKELVHHLSSSICQIFSEEEKVTSSENLPDLLHKAILNANSWVHRLAEQKKEFHGMGTTLCCLLLHQEELIYAHVGDSRIYRFREQLFKITEDHSPAANAKNFAYPVGKHIITRAIGTSSLVEPEINTSSVQPGDIYFLCSDGLTDYVSDEEISTILTKQPCIKSATTDMIERAKAKGGGDNITVLMIRVLNAKNNLSG